MKKLTGRQHQAIETKLKIIKTATDLFKSKGFGDVTIRDICDACSISIGSFYHHFQSKDEIINIGYHQLDLLWQEKIAVYQNVNTKEDILYFFEQAGILLQDQGWELASQSYKHLITSKSKYTFQLDRPIYTQLLRIIESGLNKDLNLEDSDTVKFIETLMRCSRGVIFDWCLREGAYDLQEQMRYDISLILSNFCQKK